MVTSRRVAGRDLSSIDDAEAFLWITARLFVLEEFMYGLGLVRSRSRELGGGGSGLSLVKHFVELHGGRIT